MFLFSRNINRQRNVTAAFPRSTLLTLEIVHKGEAAASTMGAPININPIQLDVTDDASIDHCATTIEQHFGKLDVLINNAGIAGRSAGTGRQPTRKEWEEVYSTNVISCALLTDAMTPLLEKASKKARVVMISSGLGSVTNQFKRERFLDAPAYNSSKSAMNALVAHYAIKFKGWRVNACAPGHVATNLNGYSEAAGKVEDGAINACRLAVQDGEEGETGTFSTKDGPLPW